MGTGQAQPLKRRASAATVYHPPRPRLGGKSPEAYPDALAEVDEVDDSYYQTRTRTSARRYQAADGTQVIERGNKRIVIHEEPPPKKRTHWTLPIVVGMIIMLALYVGFQMLAYWWVNNQLNATYGMPRTYQIDAVVGHDDSPLNPSHFIFLNLNGHVEIIELPGGNPAKARVYVGPTLFADNAPLVPVTGEFKNVGGTEEMLVHIKDQTIVYVSDGTKFVPK